MKIENETKNIEVTKEIIKAVYSEIDIKNLILADLKSQGYNVQAILFKTNYKYVSDEWGMNCHSVTEFCGAEVLLDKNNTI